MINRTNPSDEKRVCSICGYEYTTNKYYGNRHTHCTACHQLIGRLEALYNKHDHDMQTRFKGNIPIFIPVPRDGNNLSDDETFVLPPITEQEAIEFLKSKNYKILKPTYIEI